MTIPLRSVGASPEAHRQHEPPYRLFILASLALAVFAGFVLAIFIPSVLALERRIDGERLSALVRAHGQVQLIGFAALFVMGMALRLMPRFSGRPIAFPALIPVTVAFIPVSLVLRALGDAFASGPALDAFLVASALLLAAGSIAFALIVTRTLVSPQSEAEATGWFFVLGAFAFVVQGALAIAVATEVARSGWTPRASLYHQALIFLQQYGVVLVFIAGVATRALPTFTGHTRPDAAARVAAMLLAAAVAVHVTTQLLAAHGHRTDDLARVQDGALITIAIALAWVTWLTGVLRPAANRVARASQAQFWFVRAAWAWMVVAVAMILWYAVRAFADGAYVAAFETDAIRHTITVGVITMMIVGMGMLILPEFAARRMHHPDERALVLGVLVALNVAVALRIWPPIRGVDWITSDRWWPIAVSGVLAEAAVLAFALMFVQSWLEARRDARARAPAGGAAPATTR